MYKYGELIENLVVSNLKTKYSSSVLGFAWSMLSPLFMMAVLYAVFNNFFNNRQENFVIYLLIGLLTWRMFTIGTSSAMHSIVKRKSLVTKIYIPREILTLSDVLSSMISSIFEFIVFIPFMVIFGTGIHISILNLMFIPVHMIYFLIIYGLGLILASLYVSYRDLDQIWEVIVQVGFFATPIMYPISIVPEKYMDLYMLNPVTRLIVMYRDIFLYGIVPNFSDVIFVLTFGVALFTIGTLVFKRLSRRFAEEV